LTGMTEFPHAIFLGLGVSALIVHGRQTRILNVQLSANLKSPSNDSFLWALRLAE